MADEILPPFDSSYESFDPAERAVIEANIGRMLREDATEWGGTGLFLARQLDYVKARTYARKFPTLNSDLLVPDATDTPEWAETISITSYDSVGMAKVIANWADDLPRSDVRTMSMMVTVKTIGDSYGYNINEIRASRAIGAGLDVRKSEAARRAIDLKIAKIKMVGDPDYGLYGLFTQPNIPVVILPNPGPWDVLSGNEIYENLTAMSYAYLLQNKGTHNANFLALAPVAFYSASTKFFTTSSIVTALDLWKQMNPGVAVHNVIECQGADPATGADVALLYENSSDNLAHEYCMPFTQLPAEARNLEFVINNMARTGGVNVFYPLALLKSITS